MHIANKSNTNQSVALVVNVIESRQKPRSAFSTS